MVAEKRSVAMVTMLTLATLQQAASSHVLSGELVHVFILFFLSPHIFLLTSPLLAYFLHYFLSDLLSCLFSPSHFLPSLLTSHIHIRHCSLLSSLVFVIPFFIFVFFLLSLYVPALSPLSLSLIYTIRHSMSPFFLSLNPFLPLSLFFPSLPPPS